MAPPSVHLMHDLQTGNTRPALPDWEVSGVLILNLRANFVCAEGHNLGVFGDGLVVFG